MENLILFMMLFNGTISCLFFLYQIIKKVIYIVKHFYYKKKYKNLISNCLLSCRLADAKAQKMREIRRKYREYLGYFYEINFLEDMLNGI